MPTTETKAPEKPIVLHSNRKSLSVFLRSGEMAFLPGNRKQIVKRPYIAQFDRGVCVVTPDKWKGMGVSRDEMLALLRDLRSKQGLFQISEDLVAVKEDPKPFPPQ